MFWKYTLFETKLLITNRKNWVLGLLLLLFFIVYFGHFSDSEQVSLKMQKDEESYVIDSILNQFPESKQKTSEGEEIYQNLLEQSSLINYQKFYLQKKQYDDYIANGLKLNDLRLRVIELEHQGIPEYLVKPKEEIMKEEALLTYIRDNELPLQSDPIVANEFLIFALQAISGVIFFTFVLIMGSELLVYEQRNRTVVNGFPISFMNKMNSKAIIYFLFICIVLVVSVVAGGWNATNQSSLGDFSYPVLIFNNGSYEAISTIQYLLYVIGALALTTLVILYLAILLTMIFPNAYTTILIGLSLFFISDLFLILGMDAPIIHVMKFIDITNVISGDLSMSLHNPEVDYGYAIIGLLLMLIALITIIYTINKVRYVRK
ncbi:hypothetical protein [Oceanobacillus kapialis]|uniref:ABC transporter permease n=1 Tax=Oceanobacillus kapialis TaxID=481353 RepID=A0ABW5Q4L0_9BACI